MKSVLVDTRLFDKAVHVSLYIHWCRATSWTSESRFVNVYLIGNLPVKHFAMLSMIPPVRAWHEWRSLPDSPQVSTPTARLAS